jgi:hypothetical protein
LQQGGTVTNAAGGTIIGQASGVLANSGLTTLTNIGTILALGTIFAEAVHFSSGGSITNAAGTVISAPNGTVGRGVFLSGGTLVNAGTISGSGDAVSFSTGSANLLVVDPGAAFVGTVDGGNMIGATTVSTLELASGASAGTLTGLGTQFIDFALVTVDAGAQWTLQPADTIEAGVTLTNAGTLSGTVTLEGAGFSRMPRPERSPHRVAIYAAAGGTATVVTAGVIAGRGIDLVGGGSVTNQSGGTISGYEEIAVGFDYTVIVVNAGTIIGSSYAVRSAGDGLANRLIVDPGAVFIGNIYGGGGVLELASTARAGVLSGLGTSITNFSTLQFDAGAAWTVSGNDGASGLGTLSISGFTYGDTIDLTGFITCPGAPADTDEPLTDTQSPLRTLWG